ncbi:MAG: hypothetical protein KKH72_07825 [Alphaproteobacteria bacterium]|nr:hypothetical protein [Alphaproteobacteria bacterium]
MDYVLNAITGLGPSLIIAGIAAYLAVWQFRRQKHWEHRFSAYMAILNALYMMTEYSSVFFEAEQNSMPFPDDQKKILAKRYREGQDELWKQVAIGGLVLPRGTIKSIQELLNAARSAQNTMDLLKANADESDVLFRGIETLVAAARKDLGLRDLYLLPMLPRREQSK